MPMIDVVCEVCKEESEIIVNQRGLHSESHKCPKCGEKATRKSEIFQTHVDSHKLRVFMNHSGNFDK